MVVALIVLVVLVLGVGWIWMMRVDTVREHDRLCTVAEAKLGEEARHVRFHGCRADEKFLSDLSVVQASCDLGQHLAFAVGEPFETRRHAGVHGKALREPAYKAPGD